MKKRNLVLIIISVVIFVGIVGTYLFFTTQLGNVSSNTQRVEVKVVGSNNMVLEQLDEAGLIKNKLAAKIYLKFNEQPFKANTYLLDESMDFVEICNILATEDFEYLVSNGITLIEGTTIPEFATVIGEKLDIPQEEVLTLWCDKEFLKEIIDEYWFVSSTIIDDGLLFPLEGYLAPNTYLVDSKIVESKDLKAMTHMMLDQMSVMLTPFKKQIEEFEVHGEKWNIHEFLTFASIVQSESLFMEDHKKIAGVFINRLETPGSAGTYQKLQSDVTVNYANQVTKVAVTYNDLNVDSKYNTYKYAGLPVGPISSISTDILESCLEYTKMEEFFFFAIKGGTVIYTTTYQEHLDEIAKAKAEGLWLED